MIYWVILLFFGGLRFYQLGLKPPHHDEAINGFFVNQVWQQGWFHYDPTNYHGPLLFYMFALSERLFGFGVESFRLVTVFFSVLQVLLVFWFVRRRYPRSKWILIPILLSPGIAFFSRSAIHESVFAFFLTLFIVGCLEQFAFGGDQNKARANDRSKTPAGDRVSATGGVMIIWGLWGALALKETWVLLVASGVLAYGLLILPLVAKGQFRNPWSLHLKPLPWWRLGLHFSAALMTLTVLFTGWFSNWRGLYDFVYAYLPWMKTGVASSGHDKPWTHWIELFFKHEKPLLALFALLLVPIVAFSLWWLSPIAREGLERLSKKFSFGARWLVLTSVIQFAVYSAIPYKTPWCMLAFVLPCALAAMAVWQELELRRSLRWTAQLSVLVLCYYAWQEYRHINFENPTQAKHGYIYVQTDSRTGQIFKHVLQRAKTEPGFLRTRFQVAGSESWPMAWAFTPFKELSFFQVKDANLENVDFLVADAKEAALVESKIDRSAFWVAQFPIRDSREDSRWYMRKTVFPHPPVQVQDVPPAAPPAVPSTAPEDESRRPAEKTQ